MGRGGCVRVDDLFGMGEVTVRNSRFEKSLSILREVEMRIDVGTLHS